MPQFPQPKHDKDPMAYVPLRLEDYDISPTNGFLPTEPPLRRISNPYFEPWERIMDKFNQYLLAHHIRRLVRKMPVLDTSKLETQAEFQRAFTILSFMAHAFVWGRNSALSESASDFLPASISIPWVSVAKFLQINPVICCAAVCHWNWQILDENAKDPMDIDNLGTLHTFSGSTDESWFYLVTTAIEAKCAQGINAILDAVASVEEDNMERMTHALHKIAHSLRDANTLLVRIYERCDPYVFYWKIREFLAGWENMAEAGLPYGVLYEGVDDTDTPSLDSWQELIWRFRKYAGGSAAQTPLLQAFDIALGIKHYPTGKQGLQSSVSDARKRLYELGFSEPPVANSYLVRMRDYMPGGHRRFLEDLAATCRIREYVLLACSDQMLQAGHDGDLQVSMRQAYNECIDLMKAFRDKHIMLVTRYIIAQANTGPLMPAPPVTSVSSHIIPHASHTQALMRARSSDTPPPGGRLGGDSLPADPTMYPQTNTHSLRLAQPTRVRSQNHHALQSAAPSQASFSSTNGKGNRLARKVEDGSVVRGTGGTDAMQFLKQVRNETANTRI
ncbi:tryptophan 2,3- dioxygenase [Kickxella alabastrina]|uniref:Tryptophan 2,3- dioxygenase n=1 Tax=Kickxella alabastrina TaxID=61397 RepID=A0ACC1IWA9_9FUNG|nr:tryptophan 2,3- dioxygenase [Kickxella alabastrina]